MTPASLHDELRAFLNDIRRRWTAMVVLRHAGRATVAAASIVAAAAALDHAFRLDGLALVLVFGTATLVVVLAVVVAVWRMPKRPSDRQVARFIEERTQTADALAWDDSLATTIDAIEREASAQPAFLPLMLNQAIERVRALDPSVFIPSADIRRHGFQAAAGSAALLFALIVSVPSFERAIGTARLRWFPGS
ncbi:MAG: hypothetical protein ACJ731_00990, partial [Vicinamibacterales bacterium]